MKLLKVNFFGKRNIKKASKKQGYSDYYQRNLNSFGKNQMQTLIDKGISLSW